MPDDLREHDVAVTTELDRDPVERLAEEFLAGRRQGAGSSIDDYAAKHPELADRIRDLFPALVLMEDLKPPSSASRAAGGGAPGAAIERLGDFRVLREIGRGGMGVVYEAVQESLGRRVALKVLPPGRVASGNCLQRFLREAQAAARLHHTNIVPIFGVGQQDELSYYVMQFIPGQGLDRVLDALIAKRGQDGSPKSEVPSPEQVQSPKSKIQNPPALPFFPDGATGPSTDRYWRCVAQVGVQVAEALDYAHQQGVLHRDIKPANLLLDDRGTVWVADFGLAKLSDVDDLTHPNDTIGTLRYMAPEQFAGQADARTDVYSLGLTLYEMLVLRPAFDETDRVQLLRQVAQAQPPRPRKLRPEVPRDLETIVVKATANHPEHRYQTAGALAADLRFYLEDRPIRARRTTALEQLWRWCRRNRAVAALGGAALALLLAVALVASTGYLLTTRALHQTEIADREAEAQRERAEANLRLATRAFDDVFSMVASDPVSRLSDDDDEDWSSPAAEAVVTDKDAAMLESMLKFYDEFAEQNRTDLKLQKETARAYRRVGDIQRHLGHYDKAETAYRHALAACQAVGEASPERPEGLTAQAAIHNDLGVLLRDMGRFSDFSDYHRQALDILRKEPGEVAALPESRFELARTLSYLSTPHPGGPPPRRGGSSAGRRPWSWPRERIAEATDHNHEALDILAALHREAPENPRYRLAMAHSRRDRFLLDMIANRRDEAGQDKQEAIRILKKLVDESPRNPAYRAELAEAYAMVDFRNRDKETAAASLEQLRQAVQIADDLTTHWPTVPAYQATAAMANGRLAHAARAAGLPHDAQEAAGRAVGFQKGLAVEFPKVATYQFALVQSLQQQADIAISAGEPAKARKSLEESIAETEKMEKLPQLGRGGSSRRMLARQYAALAGVLRDLGDEAGAKAAAAKSGELLPHTGRHHHRSDATDKRPEVGKPKADR